MTTVKDLQTAKVGVNYVAAMVSFTMRNQPEVSIYDLQRAWDASTLPKEWIPAAEDMIDEYRLFIAALNYVKKTSSKNYKYPDNWNYEKDDTAKYSFPKAQRTKNADYVLVTQQMFRMTEEETSHSSIGDISEASFEDKAILYLVKDATGELEIQIDAFEQDEDGNARTDQERWEIVRKFLPVFNTVKEKWELLKKGLFSTDQITKLVRDTIILNEMEGFNYAHSSYVVLSQHLNDLFELQTLLSGLHPDMNLLVFPIAEPVEGVDDSLYESQRRQFNFALDGKINAAEKKIQKIIDSEAETQDGTWANRLDEISEIRNNLTRLTKHNLVEAKERSNRLKELEALIRENRNKKESK